jgi:nitroreductase/NAD-dependent dihydropyrimidine dehydrogenase PreA subunit
VRLLRVDQELCNACGACAAVCPRRIIALGEQGPKATDSELCLACGHCVAVCPSAALDHARAPLASQVSLEGETLPDATTATRFLRSRRSIRSYQQELVPRRILRELLDIARFASTGANSQGLSYLVISDPQRLHQLSMATLGCMQQQVADGEKGDKSLAHYVRVARETGADVVLRGAPHLIVALSTRDSTEGQENACFSLAYAELLAPTLGVGTCWAGLLMRCAFRGYPPLLELLDLPSGKKVAGALMAGYPRYRYPRLVDRNELDVEWR